MSINISEIASNMIQKRKLHYDTVVPMKALQSIANIPERGIVFNYEMQESAMSTDMVSLLDSELSYDYNSKTTNVFYIKDNSLLNLTSMLNIPANYVRKMESGNPDLLAENIRSWSETDNRNILIRGLRTDKDNVYDARAILSNKYKILNNVDVFAAVLYGLRERPGIEMTSFHENDDFMQFDVFNNNLDFEHRLFDSYTHGDSKFKLGFTVRNSEIGKSKFSIVPKLLIGYCSNGMALYKYGSYKTHLGMELDPNIVYSDETLNHSRNAMLSGIYDAIVQYSTDMKWMERILDSILDKEVVVNTGYIETTGKTMEFTDQEIEDLVSRAERYSEKTNFLTYQLILECAKDFSTGRRIAVEEKSSALLLTA